MFSSVIKRLPLGIDVCGCEEKLHHELFKRSRCTSACINCINCILPPIEFEIFENIVFRPIGGKLIPVNTCLTNKGCKILSEIIAKQAAVTPPGLTAKLVGAEQIVPWRKRRRRWVWTKKVEKSRKRGKARVVGAKSVVSGDTGIAQDQTGKPTSAVCQKKSITIGQIVFHKLKI